MRIELKMLHRMGLAALLAGAVVSSAYGQDQDMAVTVSRPLRYHPEGTDFVITNGEHWFNRPLYGPHTAFHVDGGDKPEFAFLNVTMKLGVLRFGIQTAKGTKYVTDAATVVTRYRPGSLLYEIKDPALEDAVLHLTAISKSDEEGLLVKAELTPPNPNVTLVTVFGGICDLRTTGIAANRNVSGVRQVDENNGADLRPRLELEPANCAKNTGASSGTRFSLTNGTETMLGSFSSAESLVLADGAKMGSLADLTVSKENASPLWVGQSKLDGQVYVSLRRVGKAGAETQAGAEDFTKEFAAAEARRAGVAKTIEVNTPDEFVNAMPGAIAVGADGVWAPPMWMHGAVSWRTGLLGWRGDYIGDALGWHDRAVADFEHWAAKQNVADDFPTVATPNPARNLSENDGKMLHSNGSIPATHYDMNMVFIDALLRHLLWTGDEAFAKKMWPVIQRHLAWEKRCFDRDGLYEAYAAIWASDALEYNGGGAAHSTAYNEFANRTAARIAHWIGEDAKPYEAEADRIHQAMQSKLWLEDRGWYAEYQDVLGEKLIHPAAALWTIYHSIDSEVPDPFQSWQCLRYLDTSIAHIPVRGPGVPKADDGSNLYLLPESNWMPYIWSLNNVVTGENTHTALAYWEGGRPEEAFKIFKGTMIDTMYAGMTPGNVPNLQASDPYRGESYTDFGDPLGMTSRAFVEGLFGIRPDGIVGEVLIDPGFPLSWDHASIKAADVAYAFKLAGRTESWSVESKFEVPMKLKLELRARGDGVESVTVNGREAKWENVASSVGWPRIEITAREAERHYEVKIVWRGEMPAKAVGPAMVAQGAPLEVKVSPAVVGTILDPQKTLGNVQAQADGLSAKAVGTLGARTAFMQVKQGDFTWWMPLEFEIRPAFEIIQTNSDQQDATHFRFRLRNNTTEAVDGSVGFSYADGTLREPMKIARLSESDEVLLPADAVDPGGRGAAPGTTHLAIDFGGGRTVEGSLLNWQVHAPSTGLEMVDMGGIFNDAVTKIFLNDYVSPRPTTCSLQIPLHGLGDWTGPTKTYDVDDSGLRRAAGKAGVYTLPNGLPFKTPGTPGTRNIAFSSQWDNYPKQVTVPLTGNAKHLYLLVAGSTTPMQSQLENGEIIVTYDDGTTEKLPLRNPTNWWPIDQNYRIDDYAFRRPEPIPMRIELGTGDAYCPQNHDLSFGGAATVLDLPLNQTKPLKSVTLHAEAYEVVMGLMGVTLQR